VYLTRSITGKPLRLTNERWVHIIEGHPEMAGHLNDVLLSVDDPNLVLEGGNDELLAVRYRQANKAMVVVCKEYNDDGFVITAFLTSKLESLLKREMIWQK